MYLYSPLGTRTKLLERNCGSLKNIDTTFSDSASSKYADFCPSEAGRGPYRGNEPLANFKGQSSFGYWRIAVENNGSENTGFLTGFSITINGASTGGPVITAPSIVSATSFKSGAVAPGEILALFGANLGPTTPVQAPGSPLPTSLAGTTVTFDGVTVPLFYVSDQLVVVQTPSKLNPGSSTNIQVNTSNGSSGGVSMTVVPARPGVFTYEAGPSGQIKAVNEDGSLNGNGSVTGADKPAAPNSVIQIYASGLGPVDPPIEDGAAAPSKPLSKITLPITATIGGLPASVAYAGPAPGLIGVYQVNLTIPRNVRSGAAPVVLSVNGNASQDDAYITIR